MQQLLAAHQARGSSTDHTAVQSALKLLLKSEGCSTKSNPSYVTTLSEGGQQNPWTAFVAEWLQWDSQRLQDAAVHADAVRLVSLSPRRPEASAEDLAAYDAEINSSEQVAQRSYRERRYFCDPDFVEEVALASQAPIVIGSVREATQPMMRFLENQRETGAWIVEATDGTLRGRGPLKLYQRPVR